jgi:hypothetical protein
MQLIKDLANMADTGERKLRGESIGVEEIALFRIKYKLGYLRYQLRNRSKT